MNGYDVLRLLVVFGGGAVVAMSLERLRVYLRLRAVLPLAVRPLVGHVTAVSAALIGYVTATVTEVIDRIGSRDFTWHTPVFLALEAVAIGAVAIVTIQERERLASYERMVREGRKDITGEP